MSKLVEIDDNKWVNIDHIVEGFIANKTDFRVRLISGKSISVTKNRDKIDFHTRKAHTRRLANGQTVEVKECTVTQAKQAIDLSEYGYRDMHLMESRDSSRTYLRLMPESLVGIKFVPTKGKILTGEGCEYLQDLEGETVSLLDFPDVASETRGIIEGGNIYIGGAVC